MIIYEDITEEEIIQLEKEIADEGEKKGTTF